MKYCTHCGNPVDPNAKFCCKCGASLLQNNCSKCGKTVNPHAKFCHHCGNILTQDWVVQKEFNENIDQKQTINVELICPNCMSKYIVQEEDWGKENVYWECGNCGTNIEGAFCGYCPSHKGYVVFRPYNNKEILGATIIGAIAGYNNPNAAFGNLVVSMLDSTPKAKAIGVCPICQAECMKCPSCNQAVQVRFEDHGVVVCPSCHLKFKMS